MKEIFLKTNDNTKIAANYYENKNESVLIIVHGWFMTKDSKPFLELSKILSKKIDILAIDCRGHGKSESSYTFTFKEHYDLEAAVDYAKQRYKNVILMGFSLGASLVLLHASKYNDVTKVIAVSPACDFYKIENKFWHPNAWIPTLQKCELRTWFSIRANLFSLIFDKKPSVLEAIKDLKVPSLFIGGEKDPTVCLWHTKALFDHATCTKRLEIIKAGLHAEDLFLQDKNGFVDLCESWIF